MARRHGGRNKLTSSESTLRPCLLLERTPALRGLMKCKSWASELHGEHERGFFFFFFFP